MELEMTDLNQIKGWSTSVATDQVPLSWWFNYFKWFEETKYNI